MGKLLVATLVTVGLAGCGKNKAVKAAEDMADEVCACKDAACAAEAAKKGGEVLMGMAKDATGTESDAKAIVAASNRMQECIKKLTK
jgi:hypothetical protein